MSPVRSTVRSNLPTPSFKRKVVFVKRNVPMRNGMTLGWISRLSKIACPGLATAPDVPALNSAASAPTAPGKMNEARTVYVPSTPVGLVSKNIVRVAASWRKRQKRICWGSSATLLAPDTGKSTPAWRTWKINWRNVAACGLTPDACLSPACVVLGCTSSATKRK